MRTAIPAISPTPRKRARRSGRIAVGAALAFSGLVGTYLGAIRPTPTYAASPSPRNGTGCSAPNAVNVGTAIELKAALSAAADGANICMTDDIVIRFEEEPVILDTSLTLDGGGHRMSWINIPAQIDVDLTGATDNAVTITNLVVSDQLPDVSGIISATGDQAGADSLTLSSITMNRINQRSLPPGNNWRGGAVRATALDRVTMSGVWVGNSLLQGSGAVWVSANQITLTESSFTGNESYANLSDRDERATCDRLRFGEPNGPAGAAAVLRARTNITVSNTIFWNNTAECDGGALWLGQVASPADDPVAVFLRDSSFAFNTSRSGSGGAIAAYDLNVLSLGRTPVMVGQAQKAGGAIDAREVEEVYLTDSGFTYNTAVTDNGGAIHAYTSNNTSRVSITRSIVKGNTADYSGGGVWATAGEVMLVDSQVLDNTATRGDGGGAYLLEPDTVAPDPNSSSVVVSRSTLSGNSADAGIGGALRSITVNRFTGVTNSTIYDNDARVAGGIQTPSGLATITLSTIVSNNAEQDGGAGVFLAEGLASMVTNSIIWNNAGPSGPGAEGSDVFVPGGNATPALIRHVIHSSADSVNRFVLEGDIVGDPLLSPLSDNGGPDLVFAIPMKTLAPLPNSPVLNVGGLTAIRIDQTGRPRNLNFPTLGSVENAIRAASAPQQVTATAGDRQAEVGWQPPDDNGDSQVTGYVVQVSEEGSGVWTDGPTPPANTRAVLVPGLTNGTAYVFRVAAVTAAGRGAFSATAGPVTPRAVSLDAPGQPSGTPSNRSVELNWAAPANAAVAGITGYRVQISEDAGATWRTVVNDSGTALNRTTIAGLTNGTAYVFRVAGINRAGEGAYSITSAAVTPTAALPSAPARPTATPGDESVDLVWAAPDRAGDSPITGYRVESTTDGQNWNVVAANTGQTTNWNVAGLVNGTAYTFRVAAITDDGTSPYSTNSNAAVPVSPVAPQPQPPAPQPVPVPPQPVGPPTPVQPERPQPGNPPAVPLDVEAQAGDQSAKVTWTAPQNDGSSPVTSYWVTAVPGGQGCSAEAPALTCTVEGLVNGTDYTFVVEAQNDSGWSPTSEPSAAVTPPGDNSIEITGERCRVKGKKGVCVNGLTVGIAEGGAMVPYIKFPGQISYAAGVARPKVTADGTFYWQRKTGKKIYIYFKAEDGAVKSNRIVLDAPPKR